MVNIILNGKVVDTLPLEKEEVMEFVLRIPGDPKITEMAVFNTLIQKINETFSWRYLDLGERGHVYLDDLVAKARVHELVVASGRIGDQYDWIAAVNRSLLFSLKVGGKH